MSGWPCLSAWAKKEPKRVKLAVWGMPVAEQEEGVSQVASGQWARYRFSSRAIMGLRPRRMRRWRRKWSFLVRGGRGGWSMGGQFRRSRHMLALNLSGGISDLVLLWSRLVTGYVQFGH